MSLVDERLKTWATERQKEVIDTINETGSERKAAAKLGVSRSTISMTLLSLKRRAATMGFSPENDMTRPVPSPFVTSGVSTYYNKDGKPTGQWVKSKLDPKQHEEIVREAVRALVEDVPRLAPVEPPTVTDANLCNLYTFTDCHVGMYAWGKETGADWDLHIAERTLVDAFNCMVNASPRARVGVVAQLGDFLHQDSISPVTPTSGHLLDADSRFSKVVRVAVRVLRTIIDLALQRHEKVIVLMAEGNHDISSSIWLRHLFGLLYENEPRVQVIDSELPYYVYQHGCTMLAWHHGHLKKSDGLPLLLAAQFPLIWGATTKRYCHTGHMHHVHEKEHAGITVIQHPTLAARDAYAARGGWLAERQVTAITYHSTWGQVARNTVVPEMFST